MKKLSIIVLNYNTANVLADCLSSLFEVKNEVDFEVIVVDNASKDDSVKLVKKRFPWVKLIASETNKGFSAGNNLANKTAKGEYILFLNPDTTVPQDTLQTCVEYMDNHEDVGAMTCKLVLPNGKLDKDARRSFPTPWVALSHFMFLDRLFPKSKLFSKYWYGYISPNTEHEVDALQGAFFLARKTILDKIGWFDETFFLNGEDLDLSWRIKQQGWKIMYYPKVSIVHLKKVSKKLGDRLKNEVSGVKSMEIFYKKHMWDRYPFYINYLVVAGIYGIRFLRSITNFLQ